MTSDFTDDAARIDRSLADSKTIALIGASANPERPSYQVMSYLLAHDYQVIPVNPGLAGKPLLGQLCYGKLSDIPVSVDMVDVFRQSEVCLAIAQEAIEIGARYFWMQIGVINDDAMALAKSAGLIAVQDKCTKIEHALRNQA